MTNSWVLRQVLDPESSSYLDKTAFQSHEDYNAELLRYLAVKLDGEGKFTSSGDCDGRGRSATDDVISAFTFQPIRHSA
jgi:hypothetical protein